MKLHLLDLGQITADEGWFLEASGASTYSQPAPPRVRRQLQMIGAVIEHPRAGPILFEVGGAPNARELWPEPVFEAFAVTGYARENRLEVALGEAGYELKDIKAVIIGHMHLDHAGGLEFFRGRDVPVYVHEAELKNAFYSVATKEDFGAYLPHYLDFSFNWQGVSGDQLEPWSGITFYRTPGHTPGLMTMRVDLPNAGTFIFTSDLILLKENYEQSRPQGWLLRDHRAWWGSLKFVRAMAERTDAHLVFGHDPDVFAELRKEKFYD